MASIDEVGLLNPITVTSDMRLVAGLHRLKACQKLGWKRIPATVLNLDKAHAELVELDENVCRRELSVLERAEVLARKKRIYEAIYPQTRRGVAGGKASGASRRGERTTDQMSLVQHVASKMGVSTRTIAREIQIANAIPGDVRKALKGTAVENDKTGLLKLSRLPVAKQQAVVERIESGEVSSVRRAMVLDATEALKKKRPRLPKGKYDVIVIDPPWSYDSPRTDYPTMAHEDIQELPIRKLSAEDCILWLWTTNAFVHQAFHCLDAWEFEAKTLLTWTKSRPTPSNWLLNQTEHAVMAVRGKPIVNLTTETTVLRAPRRQHSRKPDEFYKLIEGLCPGRRRLDMCSRQRRRGWEVWGAEAGMFDG